MNHPNETLRFLEGQAVRVRKNLLRLATQTNIHIGGDLSVCDIMTALWQHQMRYDSKNPKWEQRDRFILSKGHAAAVTSFCQCLTGCYEDSEVFAEYAQDNGRFAMHSCNLINPHVEVSTGSLGHGLPVGVGMAAGLRMNGNKDSRVYVVMGDGEQCEGSVWEAVMYAARLNLGNVVAIIDENRLCFDGTIEEISGVTNLGDRYRLFGWNVITVDGHDMAAILDVFDHLPTPDSKQPTVIMAQTIKGKGVSFMENELKWHAGTLTATQLDECSRALDVQFDEKWGVAHG